MIIKTKINDLLKRVDSKYTLVSVVAKRTRQINEGSPKLVKAQNGSNVSTASEELDEGLIEYEKIEE